MNLSQCVNLVVTDITVIEVTTSGLVLRETAPAWTLEEVIAETDAPLTTASDIREIEF